MKACVLIGVVAAALAASAETKVGIIGLDTSPAVAATTGMAVEEEGGRAVGVGGRAEPEALHLDDLRLPGVRLGREGAGVPQADRVQRLEGADDAGGAAVEAVVVRREDEVHARVPRRLRERAGRAELPARVREVPVVRRDRRLEVADHVVARREERLQVAEDVREVVAGRRPVRPEPPAPASKPAEPYVSYCFLFTSSLRTYHERHSSQVLCVSRGPGMWKPGLTVVLYQH